MTLKKSTKNRIWKKTTCEEVAVLVDFGDLITRMHHIRMSQLHKESDLCKGSTDTPQAAMSKMMITAEPTTL